MRKFFFTLFLVMNSVRNALKASYLLILGSKNVQIRSIASKQVGPSEQVLSHRSPKLIIDIFG